MPAQLLILLGARLGLHGRSSAMQVLVHCSIKLREHGRNTRLKLLVDVQVATTRSPGRLQVV